MNSIRLALNLNEMLDRLQALMESLRQVSSDIAHDLHTPLSHLRHRLESARRHAGSVEGNEAAVDGAMDDVDAILRTFAALLRIAQIEAGSQRAAFAAVDLSAVFQRIADAYGAVAEDRGQTIVTEIEPHLQVHGDHELLVQMTANLVENAIRHTPSGTRIDLTLVSAPTGPVGVIADSGQGIPAIARDRVFRRFYRTQRSRSTAGNGLGMAIVAAVADLHHVAILSGPRHR
jgi:signal transduction histidine kinase